MRAPRHRHTWHDYLVLEQSSNTKHEFYEGEIFAMGGRTPAHSALAAAVTISLGAQLKESPCRLYQSDLRVRVLATGLGTYPDVTVLCGKPEADPEDPNTLVNPRVIVEVLSDSTDAYDRGEKFASYRQIPSLEEYVLVSHREPLIEVFRRGAEDWARTEARTRAVARLDSIRAALSVDEIYAGIELHRG